MMYGNMADEIGIALAMSTIAYPTEDGNVRFHVSQAWDTAGDIWRSEDIAYKLIHTTEQAFALKVNKTSKRKYIVPTKFGQHVLQTLKIDVTAVSKYYPKHKHKLNPYVELLFEQASKRQLFELPWVIHSLTNDECVDRLNALNEFMGDVRKIGRSAIFKKSFAAFERESNKNHRGLCKLIDGHLEQYSRLLVLRIELGYQEPKELPDDGDNDVNYEDAKAHRLALLRHLKKILPSNSFVNYSLKLAYSLDKRWHYHLLVLLNGAVVCEDASLTKLIGEYWKKEITNGKGLYWNRNAYKATTKACGVGMVHHLDSAAREGLRNAALGMTETDYYVKLQVPGDDRIFWMGTCPSPKAQTLSGHVRGSLFDQMCAQVVSDAP